MIRMHWAWPSQAPTFSGGKPTKAYQWELTMDLQSGDNRETLEISTDGTVRLNELYRTVSEHVDEFRKKVGPLTGATITGKGLRPREMQP